MNGHTVEARTYECVNIDAATETELWALAQNDGAHPGQRAYARSIIGARQARLAGRIAVAVGIERDADKLYRALPPSLRW